MEPERSIEKLLRGYAQRRRQSAEPAENLHPAQRQALLAEVRLRYRPERGGWRLPNWWPRLAWALGCLLALGISAAIWLPQAFIKRDLNAQRADGLRSTQSTLKLQHQVPGTNVNVNLVEMAAAPSGQAAEATNLQVEIVSTTAADSMVVATGPTPEAVGQPAPAREFRATRSAMNPKVGSTESASATAPEPVVQRFTQVITDGVRPTVAVAERANSHPVLASFRMEQKGSEVRVVDQDGSIYSGNLEAGEVQNAPVVATARRTTTLSAPNAGRTRAAPTESSDQPVAQDSQALQQYFFKVSGTNRSLNQKVLFTGNLIQASPMASNQLPVMRQQVPRQMLLNNSRITGRAQVGSQEIRVEAVPAP